MSQYTDAVPQMRKNIDPCAPLLCLGDVRRAGVPGCSVRPTRSIQEGPVLRERVSDSIYALTRWNRIFTAFFTTLTVAQAILGVVFLTSPDNTGEFPNPTPAYRGQ